MKAQAVAVAESLGIAAVLNKRTFEVSGGQAQRAAIARQLTTCGICPLAFLC